MAHSLKRRQVPVEEDSGRQKGRVAPDCGEEDSGRQKGRVAPDCGTVSTLPRPKKKSKVKASGVEECSCHKRETRSSEDHFEKAWKAIESGDTSTFEQAILKMKEAKDGSSASLDTCHLIEKRRVAYSMSLLALCGFYGRMEMVDLLLKEGADMNAKCACVKHTGTPILQMMLHCFILDDCHELSVTMLKHFIEKGAKLSGKIATLHLNVDGSDSGGVTYSILDLPLSMKKIDCAKVLVESGVDLISGGCPVGEEFAVVPMFQEYRDHGTNEFIRWAFNEYIPKHPEIDLEKFAQRIIASIISMKKDERSCFWKSKRRAPAHAILTSHHEEMIQQMVECGKNDCLLDERSCTGKTALHIAAEENDEKSVQILLKLEADTRATDNSDMNPFMIAVEKGHLDVVKAMMKKDPGLMSLQVGSGTTVIHWALEEGQHRSAFFKGYFEEDPEELLTAKDSQGNTIAHLVAASGNTEVFEILWSKNFADAIFSDQNSKDKAPLQLAVEKGHVNILKTLKTCVDGRREAILPRWHRELKTTWWDKMVPYFLYACSWGSLAIAKHFIATGQEPNVSHDGKTPLLCAAEAGHDEILAYLLQFTKVQTDLKRELGKVPSASVSPLLIAAQNGHTACVTLLLENGGNVLQRDYKNRNCLMLAIQNHHKTTALAILSSKDGLKALEGNQNPTPLQLLGNRNQNLTPVQQLLSRNLNFATLQLSSKRDKNPTPLQLLVKEMPDLAEYVLNKCVTQDEPERQISIDGGDFVDKPTVTAQKQVHYDFKILEDKDQYHGNHILDWMIEHDRLELLQHPLVENFLFQKFWMMTFPVLLLNMVFYCTLLVALNSFALVLPRPGPDSETCRESDVTVLNGTSSECQGQSATSRVFLTAAAISLCILSFIGVLVEVMQLYYRGWRYFKDSDNYFQWTLYALIFVFINGFDNECWCSTPWQWQIGAFAVFFSWLNFIFSLKYMPLIDIPIIMFLNICVGFLKLILLPIVLILAFAIPFYMVFVRTTSSEGEELLAFRSPSHAVAKTFLQLAGEFDFEKTFNEGTLLYSPAAYILFMTFLITMPILFTNLLNALAVGETKEIIEKAELTTLKLRVELILEQERMKRWPTNCFNKLFQKVFGKDNIPHAEIAKELKEQNEDTYRMMVQNPVREDIAKLKEDIANFKQEMMAQNSLRDDITELKEDFSNFKEKMISHIKPADAVRDDIAKLKEDMAKLVQALTPKGGNGFH